METRARRIVKLAATKTECAKQWFLLDEYGSHEKDAMKYLESTAEKAKMLGLSETEVDDQIADYLAYLATSAMLAYAQRR